ncbi:MAG TPA: efflux transporter outer membrane subunit [Burkholderiales bacterium]|nr:efflux transporter outer membrane subunit [Burkholderiales bacterium]
MHRHSLRSTRRSLWLVLATSAALTACSLGPEYKRPDVPVPAAWRESSTADAATWPSAGWWRGFGSPELDDYIAQARRANNDLVAAVARVREADALATVAGAALLPTVALSATAIKERVQATNGAYVNFTQYSPQLTASYVIDFWGKNRAAQTAALATATASRHDQATVELTVMTSVALTYFQSLELRDRLIVAQGNLASAETILKGLRLQLAAGIATALDVAQQETTVSTLSALIPPLQQQFRQTVNALAILIGRAPESLDATNGSLADLSLPAVRPGLTSELLARRPDVAEAEDQLIAANASIAVARASFFPNIQLTASSGVASSALSTLLKSSNGVFAIAAGLAQPIFDGGALKGQYAFAQARYDELVANYRKAILSAFGNVEDALVAVEQTAEQERRQATAVARARRAHEIAQAQLRSGTVTILTVLNTETALFTAQDSLVQARFSHLQSLVGLFSALGGGWQKEAGT